MKLKQYYQTLTQRLFRRVEEKKQFECHIILGNFRAKSCSIGYCHYNRVTVKVPMFSKY